MEFIRLPVQAQNKPPPRSPGLGQGKVADGQWPAPSWGGPAPPAVPLAMGPGPHGRDIPASFCPGVCDTPGDATCPLLEDLGHILRGSRGHQRGLKPLGRSGVPPRRTAATVLTRGKGKLRQAMVLVKGQLWWHEDDRGKRPSVPTTSPCPHSSLPARRALSSPGREDPPAHPQPCPLPMATS